MCRARASVMLAANGTASLVATRRQAHGATGIDSNATSHTGQASSLRRMGKVQAQHTTGMRLGKAMTRRQALGAIGSVSNATSLTGQASSVKHTGKAQVAAQHTTGMRSAVAAALRQRGQRTQASLLTKGLRRPENGRLRGSCAS